ncbi:MAG: DUF1841 family protein [Sulfurimicrobium sp.]|nr:DUF1841 family protein [Sulfurimicrobium sp.]MDZ7656309.1 DUF1841 family protein [Sulfurimicrobium sp.]
MFNPSRDQARQFFFDTWHKYNQHQPLSALESMVLEILLQHPEYHALLANPERYQDRDYLPEQGETNPFLHLSLHLAIAEQLSIDQPPGIKGRYHKLLEQYGESHGAQHRLMECLGEMIWQAQRHRTSPDPAVYFSCLDRHG